MATEIPLYQRAELPPARAGIAKAPYELAEVPEARFGQVLAKFSGAIFDKLIKAQAANEEAEARGEVDTLIEGFNTFVADKPNASPEELQAEWDKVSSQIKALPDGLKTGIAKRNFTNFLALNEGVINQRAQTSMEAIKSRQELERYNVLRKTELINPDGGSKDRLAALNTEQVASGLLDAEIVEAQQKLDFLTIDAVLKKQNVDAIFDMAKEMPYTEAITFINEYPSLERADRNDLIARRERQEKIETATTDWQVYNELDNAVKGYHLAPSPVDKEEMLRRLEEARFGDEPKLAQKEYQKLKDALEKDLSTEDAYWLREARGLLDEAIRERDKLSGMLRTEEGLIAAAAMAKMALDTAMDEAVKAGKPIRGRDILIRAMQIVPMFKVPKAEWEKWPRPTTISKGVKEEVEVSWREPTTKEEFYETVRKIEQKQDEDAARAYYEEWVSKWQ